MPKKEETHTYTMTLYLETDDLRWALRQAALHRRISAQALATQIISEWLRAHPAT